MRTSANNFFFCMQINSFFFSSFSIFHIDPVFPFLPLRIKINFSLAEKNLAIRFQFFFLNIFYIKIILHDISFLSNDIIAKESCNEGKCLNERGRGGGGRGGYGITCGGKSRSKKRSLSIRR